MPPHTALPLILGTAAKATIILGLAWLLAWAMRRRAAATRHAFWTMAVITVLALPALEAATPRLRVAVPGRISRLATTASGSIESIAVPATTEDSPGTRIQGNGRAPQIAARERPNTAKGRAAAPAALRAMVDADRAAESSRALASYGLLAWLIGAAAVIALLLVERAALALVARRASPASGRLASMAARLAGEPTAAAPRVLVTNTVRMPLTWGLWRPVLLMPVAHRSWSDERLEVVLLHENAHVRRHDHLVQVVATVMAAVHWFNPLAWVAVHKLRVEREHACDDEVLRAGTKASTYASELLDLARAVNRRRVPSLCGLAMARPSHLSDRLLAVLEEDRCRTPLDRRVIAAAMLVGLGLALPVAAISPTTGPVWRESGETTPGAAGAQVAETVRAEPVATGPAERRSAAAPLPILQSPSECWEPGVDVSRRSITSDSDGFLRLEWESDGCDAEITLLGELRFNDDFSGIVGVSDGGHFRFIHREGRSERSLEIRSEPGEESSFVWRVDGSVREYDAAARDWLAAILPHVLRQTGLAAEQRVAWIYSQDGAGGVFAEVELIASNSITRRYLTALMNQDRLTEQELIRLLAMARAKISSNSTMRALLGDFAAANRSAIMAGNVGREFWLGIDGISSNSTLRALLLSLIEDEAASSDLLHRAVQTARDRISSNSTMAAFLRELDQRYPGAVASGPLAESFWGAVAEISSNSTLSRLLLDLAADEPASSATLERVLEQARAGISSSSQMSSFLIAFAQAHPEAAAGRLAATVEEMARAISSRSTRERTLRRLGISE